MKNIILFGGTGLLGRTLLPKLKDYNVIAPRRDELDLENEKELRRFLAANPCDLIINCAAMTDVDECQREPDTAYRINSRAVSIMKDCGAPVLQVSTNFIFPDNTQALDTAPFVNIYPMNAYGTTKHFAEKVLPQDCSWIVRTSYLYGKGGKNLISRLPQLLRQDGGKFYDDLLIQITYVEGLADYILDLITKRPYGVYHYADSGFTTPYRIANHVKARHIQYRNCVVEPVTYQPLMLPARRPNAVELLSGKEPARRDCWWENLSRFIATYEDQ